MKWYLLVTVLYGSFWGFLGWGIQGGVIELMITLSLLLTSVLMIIFNLRTKPLKEALMILYAPSMVVFAIVRAYNSLSTWKIIFLIIAILLQVLLVFSYYKVKRRKPQKTNLS
ncbi:hypothetical protein [Bacteroides congonensis]|uniref:hypothetical protein n=1 Tax=Bacteroides congonensis TaxID=1871006 RepID=UPI0026757899|nr:hypothetical protein [Bacteroides congonensis]